MNKFKQLTSIIGCTILLLILLVYWTPSAGATPDDSAGGTISSPNERVLRYRPNVNELREDQIQALKDAVRYMHALPKEDSRNWDYQANIHGTFDEMTSDLWNQCQHGSQYFLPWHRAYLYHFEEILREVWKENKSLESPDEERAEDELVLPYWNYDSLNEDDLKIPEIFREGSMCQSWAKGEKCNPLYVDDKHRGNLHHDDVDDTHPEEFKLDIDLNKLTNTTDRTDFCFTKKGEDEVPGFEPEDPGCIGPDNNGVFGGRYSGTLLYSGTGPARGKGGLEAYPHDIVHVQVGGSMLPDNILEDDLLSCENRAWMSNPNCSARDPLFWVHHANIDRMWAEWSQDHDSPDQDSSVWKNGDDENQVTFIDRHGDKKTYNISTFAIKDTRCYGYRYNSNEANSDSSIPDDCPPVLPIQSQQMKGRILSEEIQERRKTLGQRIKRPQKLAESLTSRVLRGRTETIEVPTSVLEEREESESGSLFPNGKTPVLIIENLRYEPGAPIYDIYIKDNKEGDRQLVGSLALFAVQQGEDWSFEIKEPLMAIIGERGIKMNNLLVELESPQSVSQTRALRPGYRIAEIGFDGVRIELQ